MQLEEKWDFRSPMRGQDLYKLTNHRQMIRFQREMQLNYDVVSTALTWLFIYPPICHNQILYEFAFLLFGLNMHHFINWGLSSFVLFQFLDTIFAQEQLKQIILFVYCIGYSPKKHLSNFNVWIRTLLVTFNTLIVLL